MRRCLVCSSFITLSKPCCICEKYKRRKLELCPLCLGWETDVSNACTREQMAAMAKFSTVDICMICAYVSLYVTELFFLSLMDSDTFILSVGITAWLQMTWTVWTVTRPWHFWNTEQSLQNMLDFSLCRKTCWPEQQSTIVSFTNEPLSQRQNKCDKSKCDLWHLQRHLLASMFPVSLPRSLLILSFKGIYTMN